MKCLFTTISIVLWVVSSSAQSIHVNQLNRDFKSYLIPSEIAYADSILNRGDFIISLASLKKECETPERCYEVSIIEERYVVLTDTLLWYPKVRRIRTDLFDSIVELEVVDYELVLSEILLGNVPPVEDGTPQLMNMCYNPRHAILIKDKADKIIVAYEVCFECGKSKVAFSRVETVEGIPDAIDGIFNRYGLR